MTQYKADSLQVLSHGSEQSPQRLTGTFKPILIRNLGLSYCMPLSKIIRDVFVVVVSGSLSSALIWGTMAGLLSSSIRCFSGSGCGHVSSNSCSNKDAPHRFHPGWHNLWVTLQFKSISVLDGAGWNFCTIDSPTLCTSRTLARNKRESSVPNLVARLWKRKEKKREGDQCI